MDDATSKLNTEQRAAVTHDAGPLMVLAGPGTGKTRVITHRIAHMVRERGIDPDRIVAVTYTTKAANQLRERLNELIGPRADNVHAHTFHGLGFRMLRRFADELDISLAGFGENGRGIIDSAQTRRALRQIVLERGLFTHARAGGIDAVVDRLAHLQSVLADSAIAPEQAARLAEQAAAAVAAGMTLKNDALDAAGIAAERARVEMLQEAAVALQAFERVCRERGWLSYADLILLPIRILRKGGHAAAILRDEWRHIVVDEFQDVNAAQIELLRLLMPPQARNASGAGPDLCVVGDDDQSIYAFRGADDRAFHRFKQIWPEAIALTLADNYRSSESIVAVSNATIAHAENRFAPHKTIRAAGDHARSGGPVELINLDHDAQAGEIIAGLILLDRAAGDHALDKYAVVVKSHLDGQRVRAALEIEGIPSVVAREDSPLADEGVQDVLAWIELLAEPRAVHCVHRIMRRPPHSADVAHVMRLLSRYRVLLSQFQAGDPGTPDPGGVADFLEGNFASDPAVERFIAAHATLRADAGTHSATEVIGRILAHEDVAHADLLSGRERAARVSNLVALLRFVQDRQDRLEPPGDIRALWSYWQDLTDGDRMFNRGTLERDIDGIVSDEQSGRIDAVHIVTAHSAKGLEFDTVFVPHISPSAGYGSAKDRDRPDLPAGVLDADDPRSAKDKVRAEARRLFYVACTRAERRLVLFAKRLKTRSRSEHYFQQIALNDALRGRTSTREWTDILKEAARVSSRGSGGWAGDLAAGSIVPVYKTAEHRRAAFEDARREVRREAAGALDTIAVATGELRSWLSEILAGTGRKMAVLTEAEKSNAVPGWARGTPAGDLAAAVLKRSESDDPGGDGAALPGLRSPLRLSYSAVDQYLRCPRCFYMRHVLGHMPVAGHRQIVGTVAHEALELFYKEARDADTGEGRVKRPDRARLIELGRQAFFRHWPRQTEVDPRQLDQVQAQLGIAFDRLISVQPPDVQTLELEGVVEFPYGAHTFTAKIDRLDQFTLSTGGAAFRIVDYKAGRPWKKLRTPPKADLQLGVYALALAHKFEWNDPVSALPPGEAEYWLLGTGQRGTLAFDAMDLAKVRSVIDEAIEGMLAGVWTRGRRCSGECEPLGSLAAAGPPGEPGPPAFDDEDPPEFEDEE